MGAGMGFVAGFAFINLLLFVGVLACFIWLFVLVIKLANRGIKALDIYIKNNGK